MAEKTGEKQVFSLSQVTRSIRKVIHERYQRAYWIKAELNKLNFYPHSGHCYPELVEKKDEKVIAQMRAVLWRTDYNRINREFQRILREPLKDGIKILFLAKISFSPKHGMSLQILDIDPSFTLGDLEKEKQETIKKLQQEGVFKQNKKLRLPLLPQRIAVISVETSKGYADFLSTLKAAKKQFNYHFFQLLFPSLLQGEQAVPSILKQLSRIKKVISHFDIVVIVRGGGGDIGLSCYNNYQLAREIACFPIPVLTGIGHATNETVAELVAFENSITPTKLADFLIQKFHDFAQPVHTAEMRIEEYANQLLTGTRSGFETEIRRFHTATRNLVSGNKIKLKHTSQSLFQHAGYIFKSKREVLKDKEANIEKYTLSHLNSRNRILTDLGKNIQKDSFYLLRQYRFLIEQNRLQIEKIPDTLLKNQIQKLDYLQKTIANLDPKNILKRGYSITSINGRAITSVDTIKKGDILKTILEDGTVFSIVEKTEKDERRT